MATLHLPKCKNIQQVVHLNTLKMWHNLAMYFADSQNGINNDRVELQAGICLLSYLCHCKHQNWQNVCRLHWLYFCKFLEEIISENWQILTSTKYWWNTSPKEKAKINPFIWILDFYCQLSKNNKAASHFFTSLNLLTLVSQRKSSTKMTNQHSSKIKINWSAFVCGFCCTWIDQLLVNKTPIFSCKVWHWILKMLQFIHVFDHGCNKSFTANGIVLVASEKRFVCFVKGVSKLLGSEMPQKCRKMAQCSNKHIAYVIEKVENSNFEWNQKKHTNNLMAKLVEKSIVRKQKQILMLLQGIGSSHLRVILALFEKSQNACHMWPCHWFSSLIPVSLNCPQLNWEKCTVLKSLPVYHILACFLFQNSIHKCMLTKIPFSQNAKAASIGNLHGSSFHVNLCHNGTFCEMSHLGHFCSCLPAFKLTEHLCSMWP